MTSARTNDAGFSLIEVIGGMLLLMVGALALLGGVTLGARRLTGSQDQLLASQRAAEAAESVFKARDNRTLTWAQIRNVVGAGADGGIFIDGPQQIKTPGPDGSDQYGRRRRPASPVTTRRLKSATRCFASGNCRVIVS
jgi:hypothetical protein